MQVSFDLSHTVSSLGTVAVVDGTELQITPLRHTIVPPPLCAVTARFHSPVQCLAFLNDTQAEVPLKL